MKGSPYGARGDDKPSVPHTEQHATADAETGDEAPEVEQHNPTRRQNLEEAAQVVDQDTRTPDEGVPADGEGDRTAESEG